MPRFFQVHIADGFVEDCEELFRRCLKHVPLTIEAFTDVWLEMNFSSIYQERTVGAEVAELSEEVIQIAKRYMVANTSNFEESVGGLFLVYCLLNLQPFRGFAAVRFIPDDVPAICRIDLVARRERRLDVLYILGEVLTRGPVQYHAEPREYGFETSLRKYHEGCTGIDKYGIRPKGVFYRQNEELDILKEMVSTTNQYEEAKQKILNRHFVMDLNYSQKKLAIDLESSLKRIANGIIGDNDSDEERRSVVSQRGDRVREIKARAMTHAAPGMRHLATVRDHQHHTDSKAIPGTSPQKKQDIRSKPGKVKSGSPKKPAATGTKRKRKEKKGKKKTRSKKNKYDSTSSSEAEMILPDMLDDGEDWAVEKSDNDDDDDVVELNVDGFHRAPIEIEESNQETPNIEELVEKEYDIHIDTVPIMIKGSSSQNFEIEFIDLQNQEDKNTPAEKKDPKKKLKGLTDISLTRVSKSKLNAKSEEASPKAGPSKTYAPMASLSKVETPKRKTRSSKLPAEYKIKKPEKRELKKPILKSKFKKLGLESVANFEDSKQPNPP